MFPGSSVGKRKKEKKEKGFRGRAAGANPLPLRNKGFAPVVAPEMAEGMASVLPCPSPQ